MSRLSQFDFHKIKLHSESLLHSLKQTVRTIGLYIPSVKTKFMSFNQDGAISLLNGKPLKLVCILG